MNREKSNPRQKRNLRDRIEVLTFAPSFKKLRRKIQFVFFKNDPTHKITTTGSHSLLSSQRGYDL
ncbi:hypothetical protein LEP1GSC188_5178 [Leptospira weilii serovar Topaz str. LT2116]|uniref:Uncharacterized protein n=1 Tax=Leptospira weilii serovar Topaz str. LT2116 TaxID=1088540 RepID=M3GVB0_9LEPT|nr:hypothetical protein LEP1GSC188_5178 [Leptospira weilii serovar Topaz str. LT2116]